MSYDSSASSNPAHNVYWQTPHLTKDVRATALQQKPVVLWLTGLSGAGKSTVANLVEKRLFALGKHTYLLDGDNIRHGLNKDLGFSQTDRVENIRRIAEVSRLFVDAGLIVLCAFIAPFRSERLLARQLLEPGEFIEIFVDAPLAIAEARDPKGLYKKARAGILKDFTGIDSPYEVPENPEIHLHSNLRTPEELSEEVISYLVREKIISNAEV